MAVLRLKEKYTNAKCINLDISMRKMSVGEVLERKVFEGICTGGCE